MKEKTFGWATPPDDVMGSYIRSCREFVNNDEAFSNFKQHPEYNKILEGPSFALTSHLYRSIFDNEKYKQWFMEKRETLIKNDICGASIFSFPEVNTSIGTVMYSWKSCVIREMLEEIKPQKVVEVGGGYGGMCLMLHELVGFNEYTIIDLPDAVALAEKYIKQFPEVFDKVNFVSCDDCKEIKDIDLFIADASLAECDEETQMDYFQKFIKNSKAGYIVYNTLHVETQRSIHARFISELSEFTNFLVRDIGTPPVGPVFGTPVFEITFRGNN